MNGLEIARSADRGSTFWSLRLKLIFHWKAHFVILVKSLFKSFVALLILCTNNEVSPANSFGLH